MKIVQVGIDLGNSMLKGARFKGEDAFTVKVPNQVTYEKNNNPKVKKFTMNGNTTYFGMGKLNNNVLKHKRSHLLDQVLVMIHELYPEEKELKVDLKIGLPPEQLFNDTYLKEYEEQFPIDKIFEYEVNGSVKKVNIIGVEVLAEGYSGFVNIVDEINEKRDILSIDVGGGTTDICNYTYDYDDKVYYPNITLTIEHGIIDFATLIADNFNNTHGADVPVKYIDTLLANNEKEIEYGTEKYKIGDYIDAIDPLVKQMLNDITNKYGQLDRYVVIGLGGGYHVFQGRIKDSIAKEIELDDNKRFYANAIGYLEQ